MINEYIFLKLCMIILDIYGLSIFMIITVALKKIDACFHKWKGMLTWNRPLKMKHLKRGKIYYQWNHESIHVTNFVSHKNDFDDLNLKWVLSKSWSWFIKLNELKMNNDFSLEWLWLVFLVFMIWFLCNSLYSWNIYLITQLFLFNISQVMIWMHEIFMNLFWCMQWEVSIMHGRMQCDKLIPWWFEIFMIWNDAYAFYYDNVWCVSWMLKKN